MSLNETLSHLDGMQEFAKHTHHLVVADHAGSGKTLAYLIPTIQALRSFESSSGGKASKPNCPAIVIVAPTQELCVQVLNLNCPLQIACSPLLLFGQLSMLEAGYAKSREMH